MPDEDLDLRMKLLRMQRRMLSERAQEEAQLSPPPAEDSEKIVRGVLRERGSEVLDALKQQFPLESKQIIGELTGLVKGGELNEITGGWLYSLLHQMGIPVRVKTTIQIESDGKIVSIADKMKEK